MKQFLRAVLSVVIACGVAVALWPLGQMAYGRWSQHALLSQWPDSNQARQQKISSPTRSAAAASHGSGRTGKDAIRPGATQPARAETTPLPPTRIVIPEIGLDAVVVQGFDEASLRRGPGHLPTSALPGQPGNCVIAAHRNVYGAWFYKVDQLWPGSTVTLRTPRESFEYRIISIRTIGDSDISVLAPPPANEPPRLTLLTCTVPRTTYRIAVTAQLISGADPDSFWSSSTRTE